MSYLSNLRIVSKLALAFSFIIVTLVTSSVLIWNKMSFIEDTTRWTSHTHNVLEKLNGAMAAMVDQETGVRGFLVSGDEDFLAPFKNGQALFAGVINDAKQLTSDNAQQQERLAKIEQLAATWVRDIAEKEIALMRDPSTSERAREMEASGAGKAPWTGFVR